MYHLSDMHLYYNMVSFVYKGYMVCIWGYYDHPVVTGIL